MEGGILGALRVHDGTADRAPRGQRSRDLLAALILRRGQVVDPGVLLDQVWGDASGLTAAVVHTQVARLRRDVGSAVVLTAETGYRVAELDLDADRFTDLLTRARGDAAGSAIPVLRQALSLWRADRPYADVTDELAAADAARLLSLRTVARELLAERLLDRGDRDAVDEAAEVAELLVGQDPWRERGHELAILAAARAGRRAEALGRYERLRTTLLDELGIDPGPEAQELHLRVLRDQVPQVAPERRRESATRAPAPTTHTHGRDDDLARLQQLLEQRRLVSVVGLGGVGKSRLLAELALALGERVAAYVDLASLPERPGEELLDAVGGALDVALDASDPLGSVVAAIGDRDTVLLADEAERCVTEAAVLVGELLSRCPRLRIVVTSRLPLGVVAEAVHVLAPLAVPSTWASAVEAAATPAVVLLRERIADRAPELVQGEDALLRLADFARQVDGIPLALQLLAAQAPGRTLDQLAELVAAPGAVGWDGAGLPDRHRSLPAAIGWSLDRLPDDELIALRRLSVFAGRFEGPAAAAVVGEDGAEASVRALVRDALVQVERCESGLSFRLLRPVRDLARQRLDESGERADALRRHRRWHADRWRGAMRSDALLHDVRDHYSDYVEALRNAHEAGDGEEIHALTTTLGRLWSFADMLGPGLRWHTRAIDSGLLTPLERARLMRMRAALQLHDDPEAVRRDLAESIEVFRVHDDVLNLAYAHSVASIERSNSGALEEAAAHSRLAVTAARGLTEERLADMLGAHAAVVALVDREEARAAAREAWGLVSRSGSSAAVASVATNLAWAQLTLDSPQAALDLLDRAMAQLPPEEMPTFLRHPQGWALLAVGDAAGALAAFDRIVADSGGALEGRGLAEVYLGAACALAELGHASAPELLTGSESMATRAGRVFEPWQTALLLTAHERVREMAPAPWGSDGVPGRTLAALVRVGAAAVASVAAEGADDGRLPVS